jgi:hypothetical protein
VAHAVLKSNGMPEMKGKIVKRTRIIFRITVHGWSSPHGIWLISNFLELILQFYYCIVLDASMCYYYDEARLLPFMVFT